MKAEEISKSYIGETIKAIQVFEQSEDIPYTIKIFLNLAEA